MEWIKTGVYLMGTEILMMCLKIFFARIADVSLGTLRVLTLVNGRKWLAALLGFVEVSIWFMIVREALSGPASIFVVISYAGGFAVGNLVGSFISERFIQEKILIQVIVAENEAMASALRDKGFGVTTVEAKGRKQSRKMMLLLQTTSNRFDEVEEIVESFDEKAFITVQKTKTVLNGFFIK